MLKRISSFTSAIVIGLSSLFVFAPNLVHAVTDDCTWTGGGTADNFNDMANWSCSTDGVAIPQNGDSLMFNVSSLSASVTLNNDLTNLSVGNIGFIGSGSYSFTIAGSPLTVTNSINAAVSGKITANITAGGPLSILGSGMLDLGATDGSSTLSLGSNNLTISSGGFVVIDSVVSGSGSLIINNVGQTVVLNANNATYSGAITVTSGSLSAQHQNALGTAAGATTVADGASLVFYIGDTSFGASPSISEPFALSGDGEGSGSNNYALGAYKCAMNGCTEDVPLTLTGAITLGANTTVSPGYQIKLTGALSGAYTIKVAQGAGGSLIVAGSTNTTQTPNGTSEAPKTTTTLSDSQPTVPVTVNYNETVIITGARQNVSVTAGGKLMGTGTVASVNVYDGGIIAPGLSPGCLVTSDLTFSSGSTYEFEIGGATECTEYDQIKVTGTVTFVDGALNTILFNGFKPVKDQVYKIIDNDAADAVTGTFLNLAEGATFEVDGYVLKISYVGGDGNDVTLTVQTVPTTPDTGFKLLLNNPILTLVSTTVLAGAMLVLARKHKQVSNR